MPGKTIRDNERRNAMKLQKMIKFLGGVGETSRQCVRSVIAIFAATFALSVSAVNVNDTVNINDSRYMTTGCKYSGTFITGGTAGIWVKNITDYKKPSCLLGNRHINPGYVEQGLLLCLDDTGNFAFRLTGTLPGGATNTTYITAAGTSGLINDGDWHFVMGTFDYATGKMRLYVDGAEKSSADITITAMEPFRCLGVACLATEAEVTAVECDPLKYGCAFKGLFSEVSIWNRALSAAEVATLYTRRAIPWENGLVGYWPIAGDTLNWAVNAKTREDGSRANALFYYRETCSDDLFFDMPSGLFVVPPAWAREHSYTQPEGATFTSFVDPATNIQDAVLAAASGNTVHVLAGTYLLESPIAITNKNITLASLDISSGTPSRDATILDGQARTRVVDVFNNASYKVVVHGFTITNGTGIAVWMEGGNPSQTYETAISKNNYLVNCRVTCSTRPDGGISSIYISRLGVVTNCIVNANHSSTGAAVGWTTDYADQQLYPGLDYLFRRVSFIDCTIEDNVCEGTGSAALGGTNCAIFDRCVFRRNYNVGGTADIPYKMPKCSSVYNCTFEDTPGNESAPSPASILKFYGKSAMSNCVVRGCRAKSYLVDSHSDGDGDSTIHAKIHTAAITNNTSGIATLMGTAELRNSLLAGNGSETAVWVYNYPGIVSENTTVVGYSKAFVLRNIAMTNVLVNSIIYGNATSLDGGGGTARLYVTNSIVAGLASYSVADQELVNKWSFDPKFSDAEHGDWRLRANSRARERGVVLDWLKVSLDLGGNPRIANLKGAAHVPDALPDLGCFECVERVPNGMMIFIK